MRTSCGTLHKHDEQRHSAEVIYTTCVVSIVICRVITDHVTLIYKPTRHVTKHGPTRLQYTVT